MVIDVAGVVASVRYKPGWSFKVGGPGNTMLCVFAPTPDSWHPESERTTQHQFAIPDPPFDVERWLLECLLLAERHECCEFFEVGGVRPFYPHHQGLGSPYVIVDRRVTDA